MKTKTRPVPFHEPMPLAFKLAAAVAGFPPAEPYLIGVSGGRDSVALLHLLVRTGFHKLIVCHLDHGLRGRSSSEDARFVARLAARLRLVSLIEKADVASLAEENKQSIETAARKARYEFFART